MKAGWQTNKLGEVCSFLNRGISPKYLEEGGICVLNQKCVRDHEVNFSLARRHDTSVKSVSSERLVQAGDVLINSTGTGTLGRVAQLRETPIEPTTVDSHVTIARPIPGKFFSDFFGYMLIFIEEAIKEAGEGCGGQTELARAVLAERFSVSYPISHLEQQRIVAIFDEAFNGIATAKVNAEKNLQNARALFESHLQSVFTERGVEWMETTVGDQLTLQRGFDITKSEQRDGTVPVVSSGGIKSFHDTPMVNAPGVVIGRKGTLGKCFFLDQDFWPHDTTLWVKDFKANKPRFVYYLLLGLDVKHLDSGTANPALNRNQVHPIKISWPPVSKQQELIAQFDSLSEETQRLESLYQQKLTALDDLKKSLLHQAFSGNL
ncbi:MAG: restriction endonuclease subunit S [Pseudomonadaceae bacterium]|nr:restriction endonuclease subunit S [Pseudomonadaceae bacterium]